MCWASRNGHLAIRPRLELVAARNDIGGSTRPFRVDQIAQFRLHQIGPKNTLPRRGADNSPRTSLFLISPAALEQTLAVIEKQAVISPMAPAD